MISGAEYLEEGDCPVCGSTDVYLYDTETRSELNDFFFQILDLYETDKKLPDSFPMSDRKYLVDELIENWKLFNHRISKSNVERIVKCLCADYEYKNHDIFIEKVGLIDKYNPDKIKEYALVKTNNWNEFVNELRIKNRYHNNSIKEEILKKVCSYLETQYKTGQKFYRGRISKTNKGYTMEEMGAPPEDKARPGRANAEGIRHLYLANDEKTTIHEVRAGAFDIISVGTFELKKDITVVDFQLLDNFCPFTEGIDLLEYAINIEHLRKMNNEMSKTLRRNDSSLDYLPTQFIADYIKSFTNYDGQSMYSGIKYQSTMNRSGHNLVAFYPDDFECIDVKVISVKDIQYNYSEEL
jgi:hypothetical protein